MQLAGLATRVEHIEQHRQQRLGEFRSCNRIEAAPMAIDEVFDAVEGAAW